MSGDPLEALLEKLCSGDAAAAEQVFVAYEPYLRMVVRRRLPPQLRAKFDSLDIVQSIWADLLHGFRDNGWHFVDAEHLRAFLVKVTQHRFIDRVRKYRTTLKHERVLGAAEQEQVPAPSQPRPSEVAEAHELWQQMLTLCPRAYHELLRLKWEGNSLDEIAAQTGLHKSSVRRILYKLARRLAARQQKMAQPPGMEER